MNRIAPTDFMSEIKSTPLCVSVCEPTAAGLHEALTRAALLGDMVEVRLDCLAGAELNAALESLDNLLASRTKPFIITMRPAEQGGAREIDSLNRIAFWLDRLSGKRFTEEFADIELDIARVLMEKEGLDWTRVICSHHDFSGRAADYWEIYNELRATAAPVIKIAFSALDATDSIQVFKLLERAQREGRKVIALAMGAAGFCTRILAPARGSLLTYGSLDKEHATAPGQPTAEELRSVYRVERISARTEIMGLVAGSIAHSVSPHIHNAAFEESGRDAVYIPFEVRDVCRFLRRMAHPRSREIEWRLRGLSVTAPHKQSVMEHLDWIEDSAREIGAVNTIVVEGLELHGYNTDAEGFLSPLVERGCELREKEVAVIGAGGAARGVLWTLRREGARVTIFARDGGQAEELAAQFGARAHPLTGALFNDFEIVVNATPLGTRGTNEQASPATASALRGARLCYDLVYNPVETRFLREAGEAGCRTLGGLEMLLAQAAAQFRLWTGEDVPIEAMRGAARKALGAR